MRWQSIPVLDPESAAFTWSVKREWGRANVRNRYLPDIRYGSTTGKKALYATTVVAIHGNLV